MDVDIVAMIISKSQKQQEVSYYLITGGKKHASMLLSQDKPFFGVLSVKMAFREYVVFFFLKKKYHSEHQS